MGEMAKKITRETQIRVNTDENSSNGVFVNSFARIVLRYNIDIFENVFQKT